MQRLAFLSIGLISLRVSPEIGHAPAHDNVKAVARLTIPRLECSL